MTILNDNQKDTDKTQICEVVNDGKETKPDELSGLHIEAKFRIFDPVSDKTIIEGKS